MCYSDTMSMHDSVTEHKYLFLNVLGAHTRLSLRVCVCVLVCPFIDVCEGPGRGAKSKASSHNWVTGTSDGLKHGLGDAGATLGCLRCQGQSALINRLGPYITALVVLAARSRQALWDFSLRQASCLSFLSSY